MRYTIKAGLLTTCALGALALLGGCSHKSSSEATDTNAQAQAPAAASPEVQQRQAAVANWHEQEAAQRAKQIAAQRGH